MLKSCTLHIHCSFRCNVVPKILKSPKIGDKEDSQCESVKVKGNIKMKSFSVSILDSLTYPTCIESFTREARVVNRIGDENLTFLILSRLKPTHYAS